MFVCDQSTLIFLYSTRHQKSMFVIIIIITFMQSTYNYVPETNHISRVKSVAAVLYLQFALHVMFFRP